MPIKCLVVDCLTTGDGNRKFTRDFIGAGPRYIAGFIEEISQKTILTSLCRAEDILSSKNRSEKWLIQFPIICISAMTMDLNTVALILREWQQVHPNILTRLVILGGPIASDFDIRSKISPEDPNCIDLLIPGEAESILVQLFQVEVLTNLLSQAHLEKKIVLITKYTNYTQNQNLERNQLAASWFADSTGFPDKILAYPEFPFARIYVELVRGCSNFYRTSLQLHGEIACSDSSCGKCHLDHPQSQITCPAHIPPGCGFCSAISCFGSSKSRNILPIIHEIKTLISLGAHRIVLGAPDFLDFYREKLVDGLLINPAEPEPNYAMIDQLIHELLRIPQISNHQVQIFIENVKASLCTDRALDLIAQLPNSHFSIGCETGSREFASILGRPNSPEITLDAVQRAIQRRIRVHVYFIHSLPGDTAKYTQETLSFMQSLSLLNIDKITLYKYQELPGSPFYHLPSFNTQFDKATRKNFEKIKRFVIGYNNSKKTQLLGQIVSVYLSEKNRDYPSDAIGWILEGGPKVSVQNAAESVSGAVQSVTKAQEDVKNITK